MKPKRLKKSEIQAAVKSAIQEATDYIESEVAPDRILAQKYWKGETRLSIEEGRSKVVATKVRDTIRTLKPALMRIFLQSEKPVEFVPKSQETALASEQATNYAAWKFRAEGGYKKLQGVFHDALLKKAGILKVYYEEVEDVDFEEYTNLTDDEFAMIVGNDDLTVVEHSERQEMIDTPEGPMPIMLHDMKGSFVKSDGKIRIDLVPPEEFFVDSAATSTRVGDFFVIGHSAESRVGDVVEMGFDFEEVLEHAGTGNNIAADEEAYERNEHHDQDLSETRTDPSMRPVLLTEAYMRMDVEGVGIPKLYRFICIGDKYHILDYSPADEVPFCIFECDPEPGTFFGDSIADITINDQDVATSMLRGLIDNVAMVNSPKTYYREGSVSVDDLLNNEVGALVATKDPQTDVREAVVPPTSSAVLPAMQYFDGVVDAKTGVSRAGFGMDTDALQGQTVGAVNAAVQAASAAAELIARNFAEGGMTELFRLIARLAAKHVEPGELMQVNGAFVPVDPRAWKTDMDMQTNVGLGTGAVMQRIQALMEHHQWQLMIWQTYGPSNGLVSMVTIRETRAEILRLSGVHNVEKHLNAMTPEIERQIQVRAAQEAAQKAQQPGDPQTQAFLQVEGQKAQIKAQTDMAETQRRAQADAAKHQVDVAKFRAEDDRKRDEMEQKAILEGVEKGIDPAMIRALQARPRN